MDSHSSAAQASARARRSIMQPQTTMACASGAPFRTPSGSPERAPRGAPPAAPRRTRADDALKFALAADDLHAMEQILDADFCVAHLSLWCGSSWMTPVVAAIHYKCSVAILTARMGAGADTAGALTALVECCGPKEPGDTPRNHRPQLVALAPGPAADIPFAWAPGQWLAGFSF